jgi:hypothetical protein
MKKHYRSILVITATIAAVSLYAFLGPDPGERDAEKQLETVVATASINKQAGAVIDQATGLPVIKVDGNELVFTNDIPETIAAKLMEQLSAAGFINTHSKHKMILGREPNNYIIFYSQNAAGQHPAALKKLLRTVSSKVFNHQPVVVKVINERKEVVQVLM